MLDLFLRIFGDIAPNAVPVTAHDYLYNPLVLQFRDDATQHLVGAALTCRAQVAAGSVLITASGGQLPPAEDCTPVLDKHSELDLIGVVPTSPTESTELRRTPPVVPSSRRHHVTHGWTSALRCSGDDQHS